MTWESNQMAKYEGCLMHYGIGGMRWGVRRFQNKDGSLTPEGKLRYATPLGTVRKAIDDRKQAKAEKYIERSEGNYRSAKDANYWRTAIEKEGKNKRNTGTDNAWHNETMRESSAARAAIRNAKKADKLTGENTEAKLREQMKKDGVTTIYNKKLYWEMFREASRSNAKNNREMQDAFDRAITKAQEREDLKNGVYSACGEKKVSSLKVTGMPSRHDFTEKFKADKKIVQEMKNFDKMPPEEQKSLGDKILKSMVEQVNSRKTENYDPDNEYNFNPMDQWVAKRVMDKSGTDTQIGSVTEANRVAKEKYDQNADALYKRNMEIRKKIGFQESKIIGPDVLKPGTKAAADREKELKRLRNALDADHVYAALMKQNKKLSGDWAGVVLKDIGFRDTPENRAAIWPYVIEVWD